MVLIVHFCANYVQTFNKKSPTLLLDFLLLLPLLEKVANLNL
jgi:hypothetical protein